MFFDGGFTIAVREHAAAVVGRVCRIASSERASSGASPTWWTAPPMSAVLPESVVVVTTRGTVATAVDSAAVSFRDVVPDERALDRRGLADTDHLVSGVRDPAAALERRVGHVQGDLDVDEPDVTRLDEDAASSLHGMVRGEERPRDSKLAATLVAEPASAQRTVLDERSSGDDDLASELECIPPPSPPTRRAVSIAAFLTEVRGLDRDEAGALVAEPAAVQARVLRERARADGDRRPCSRSARHRPSRSRHSS